MIRPHSRIKDNLIISFIILYTSLLDIITQTPITLIPLLPLHFVIPLSGGIYWPSPSSNLNPFTPLSHPILSSYCLNLSLPPLIPQALIPLAPSFHPSLSYHHFTSCTLLSHPSHSTPFTQLHRATPITSSTALLSYPSLSSLLTRSFHHTLSPHHLTSLAHPSHPTHPQVSRPCPFTPLSHSTLSPIPFTPLLIPYYISHSVHLTLSYLSPNFFTVDFHPLSLTQFFNLHVLLHSFYPTHSPNPFAGLSPSHLTFTTYSPNQLRWDWVCLSLFFLSYFFTPFSTTQTY